MKGEAPEQHRGCTWDRIWLARAVFFQTADSSESAKVSSPAMRRVYEFPMQLCDRCLLNMFDAGKMSKGQMALLTSPQDRPIDCLDVVHSAV
jgi:hypothetical protein